MNGKCKHCGRAREEIKTDAFGGIEILAYALCDCEEAQAERQREIEEDIKRASHEALMSHVKRKSRMLERSFKDTFDTFKETRDNKKARDIAIGYVNNFESTDTGLLIYGAYGTGKTHLANAIANYFIQRREEVINCKMLNMLNEIRKDMEDNIINPLDDFKETPLLIIDDLGKERLTEWGLEQVFDIIDARYQARLPLIITTNLHSDQMKGKYGGAIIDRLMEMCKPITLTGESWRTK